MSKTKEINRLIESLSDYAFAVTEAKKELGNYAQLVDDMAEEIIELKAKIKKLEGDK